MTTSIPEQSDTEPVAAGPPEHPADPLPAQPEPAVPARGRKDGGLPSVVVQAAAAGPGRGARTKDSPEGAGAGKGRPGRKPVKTEDSPWQRSHAVWDRSGLDWSAPGAVEAAAETSAEAPKPSEVPEVPEVPEASENVVVSVDPGVFAASAEDGSAASTAAAQAPDTWTASAAAAALAPEPDATETLESGRGDEPDGDGALAKDGTPDDGEESEDSDEAGDSEAGDSEAGDGEEPGTARQMSGPRKAPEPASASTPGVRVPARTPPVRPVPQARRAGRARRAGAVAVVLVLAGGTGAYALLSGEDTANSAQAVTDADRIFMPDPAAKEDGRAQTIEAVAAAGKTVVALGSEQTRGQFLTSVDGGRSWRLAHVRAADGDEPPPAEFPRQVAGGAGAWVALGGPAVPAAPAGKASPGQMGGPEVGGAVWTSGDGRAWTRQPAVAAFRAADDVRALVRTASGFTAVGRSEGVAAVWLSADGRTWQRAAPAQTKLTGALRLDRLAATGDTLVAQGVRERVVTRTVTRGGKKRRITTRARSIGHWRSADGGRTWAAVAVPQRQGSYGSGNGLVSGPGGFFLTRDARYATGKGKRRKLVRSTVVFRSADGAKWDVAGRITGADLIGMARLSGAPEGLAALVRVRGGKTAVMRSSEGRAWSRTSVISGRTLTGLAVLPSGTVVTGRDGDDAYLSLPGSGDVDLARIEGAVRPDRAITALVPNGGQVVAVGGTNGDAAVWIGQDGRSWTRAEGTGFGGDGTQRLTDAAGGGKGWVAVGRTPDRPLVMTSADGTDWKRASGLSTGFRPAGAAYGPSGYVLVGKAGAAAAAWHSTDLKKWTRGSRGLGAGSMTDVTTVPGGYVAVGSAPQAESAEKGERGKRGKRGEAGEAGGGTAEHPMVWTSADGAKWTPGGGVPVPPGAAPGGLTQVVAHGEVLVALGGTGFVGTSADGGKTWQSQVLQAATTVAATSKGFVAAGTAGAPGRGDVVLWNSADGGVWRLSRPHGSGLDGRGAQRLTALTTLGDELLAVGLNGDHRGDRATLWRTPSP